MLLTYAQSAERLAVSVSMIRALARAAELAGAVPADHVPPRLRRYLDTGFPLPRYIGGSRRLARIDVGELDQWMEQDSTCT